MEQSMIVNRIWTEMHKIKGYVVQIEIYTSRKRNGNKLATICAIVASVLCFLSSIIPGNIWWITSIIAFASASSMLLKEFLPFIKQPESELIQLDRIHDFYKEYLRNLENLFTLRYNKKTDIDDGKMLEKYNEIAETEGSHESDLNRLQLKLTNREEKKVIEITRNYFQINYPQL